jgi:hypothetical protein
MITRGALVVADDCRSALMVVAVYPGLYGREMVDAMPCHPDMTADETAAYWVNPLGYFADELSIIKETAQ